MYGMCCLNWIIYAICCLLILEKILETRVDGNIKLESNPESNACVIQSLIPGLFLVKI